MNYVEYLEFLLDIKLKMKKYKEGFIYFCRHSIGEPVSRLLWELDMIINTPSIQLKQNEWFNVGYLLGQYFGEEGVQMVYNKDYKWEKWQ